MRTLCLLTLLLFAAPGFAQLVEAHFPDKTEAQVAADFEAGLPAFLDARLKEPLKPRIYMPLSRSETVYMQFTAIDNDSTTWQTLVRAVWSEQQVDYAWDVHGKTYSYKLKDIPTSEVAGWYRSRVRTPAELVSLACWLAGRNDLMSANARLAQLAEAKPELKADIDKWLCAKHGWSLPSEGLIVVVTHDLARNEDGRLLMTKEAADAHHKALDKQARDDFKVITKFDVKGKPGARRTRPEMRLALFESWCKRYAIRYANTATFANKRNKEEIDAVIAAVQADMVWIKDEGFKAERLGIDAKWAEAARAYELLLRADPYNTSLIEATAQAWHKAADVSDLGRKAEDKAAAARAGALYEELLAIYPRAMGYHNHAGLNFLAAGETRKAKAHHTEVMRRTDNRADLSDSDKQNREYAEKQLELIK